MQRAFLFLNVFSLENNDDFFINDTWRLSNGALRDVVPEMEYQPKKHEIR